MSTTAISAGSQVVQPASSGMRPEIAPVALSDGGYALFWDVYTPGIHVMVLHGQRYTADGQPVGAEIVAPERSGSLTLRNVLQLESGNFLVVSATSGNITSLQVLDPAGNARGAAIEVIGQISAQSQVALLENGGFALTFVRNNGNSNVFTQAFDANGVARGAATQVNTTELVGPGRISGSHSPLTAGLADGGYVVAWTADTNGDVYAQRYDSSGHLAGRQFQVESGAGTNLTGIVGLSGGGFVVSYFDGFVTQQYAQIFDASGARVGAQIDLDQASRVAGALPNGGFFTQGSFVTNGQLGANLRLFNADGTSASTSYAPPAGGSLIALADGSLVHAGLKHAPQGTFLGIGVTHYDLTAGAPSGPDAPRTVTVHEVPSVARGRSVQVEQLFSTNDPDGDSDAVTQYRITNLTAGSTGTFLLDGDPIGGSTVTLTAAELARTRFRPGAEPSDQLQIEAFDGQWSTPVTATVVAGAELRDVGSWAVGNQKMAAGREIEVAAFIFSDTYLQDKVRFVDATATADSGFFKLNGVEQAANQTIEISVDQLSSLTFQAGNGVNTIRLSAYENGAWSDPRSFTVSPGYAPTLAVVNHEVLRDERVSFAQFVSAADADGDMMTRYRVTLDAAAEGVRLGTPDSSGQQVGVAFEYDATRFAQLQLLTGRGTSSFTVQAFDGWQWSAPQSFTVTPYVSLNYTVSVSGNAASYQAAIQQTATAAIENWSRFLSGRGSVDILIDVDDLGLGTLAVGGFTEVYNVSGPLYRAGTIHELMTGTDLNGADPDIVITLNQRVLNSYAFDPLWTNPASAYPNQYDGLTILMHELGHGLGFIGVNDTLADQQSGGPYLTFDQNVTFVGGFPSYSGRATGELLGGVTLRVGDVSHLYGSFPDLMEASLAPGTRKSISLVDAAMLNDAGAPLARFSFTPRVIAPNREVAPNSLSSASSLFSVSDIDGDTPVWFQFEDDSPGGGYWVLNGVQQTTGIRIAASELGNLQYQAGFRSDDRLSISTFDGRNWSGWASVRINSNGNTAPIVAAQNITLQRNQVVAAGTLFNVIDAENDSLVYTFRDTSTDQNAGYLLINGQRLATNIDAVVFADQLGSVTYRAGTGGTSMLQVRASDRRAPWTEWTSFQVGTPPNFAPIVSAPSVVLARNQVVAAASLFSVTDAEGDSLVYSFRDNSTDPSAGYWLINGQRLATNSDAVVFAADLGNVAYRAGSNGTSNLQLRVSDRVNPWTGWTSFQVGVPPNFAPTVAASNVVLARNQVVAASSLFSVTDAEGDSLVYSFRDSSTDPSAGYWQINGQRVGLNTDAVVFAADLASVTYRAGSNGSSNLSVRVSDRVNPWTTPTSFTVGVPPNFAPTVAASNVVLARNQVVAASSLFSVTDPEGDSLVYSFRDNSTDPSAGYWLINGQRLATNSDAVVFAADLGNVAYRAGTNGTSNLQLRISDRVNPWTAWTSFQVGVPPNFAPTVTAPNVTLARNQTVAASSLFSVTDPEGDSLVYSFRDNSTDPSAGYWMINGQRLATNTDAVVFAADLGNVTYRAGTNGTSNLQLRVSDRVNPWTAWTSFQVGVPPNFAPTVTAPNVTLARNQTVAASSLFSVADPEGDSLVYSFRDNSTDPSAGYWLINGQRLATNTDAVVFAADLGNVTYRAGSNGVSNLQVRVSDRVNPWTAWTSFQVGVPPNFAPTVTGQHNLLNLNNLVAASTLFGVTDPEGDSLVYTFRDNSTDPSAGFLLINGLRLAANTEAVIFAADLGNVTYRAGALGSTANLQVRVSDRVNPWTEWTGFTATTVAGTAPILRARNQEITPDAVTDAWLLFDVGDADGDAITAYRFLDTSLAMNSGFFLVDGVPKAPGRLIEVNAADLLDVTYQAGVAADALQMSARDSRGVWSITQQAYVNDAAHAAGYWMMAGNDVLGVAWRSPFENSPPVVTAADALLRARHTDLNLGALLQISDLDTYYVGDQGPTLFNGVLVSGAVQMLEFRDDTSESGTGTFVLHGQAQSGTTISVSAADFNAGNFAFRIGGPSVDRLQVRVSDGIDWSAWDDFTVSSTNDRPVVTQTALSVQAGLGQAITVAPRFSVSDPDGDTPTRYQFVDATLGGGQLLVGGVAQAADQIIDVLAGQLASTAFQAAGSAGGADAVFARAFDGVAWSAWKGWNIVANA